MSDALLHNWKPADEREQQREGKKRKATKLNRGASKPQPAKDYRPLLIRLAAVVGILALLLGAFAWVRHQQLQNFTIRSIEITGSREFVTSEQVSGVLQRHAEGDFFNIEIDTAREALLALPWVREVSLRREWPDRLLIKLREQQAVARWGVVSVGEQPSTSALLNEAGQSFAGLPEASALQLPSLLGPQGSQQKVLQEYAALNAQMQQQGVGVLQLTLDARSAWEMQLDNGINVRFLERNKPEALQRLATALRVFDADRLKQAAKIDLRYSNGFAIEWKTEVENGLNV